MASCSAITIEPALPGDWPAIVSCLDQCFTTPGQPSLAATHNHCVYGHDDGLSRYLVARAGDRIIGCVSIVPQTLMVDGGTLNVAGLGQVATLPEHRGRGVMSDLLNAAIARMDSDPFAFSDLGGDRIRYGRYGWETAGRQWQFTLTPRSAQAATGAGGDPHVRRYMGDHADLLAMMALHESEPWRVDRGEDQSARLFSRARKETWLATQGTRVMAYAVIDPSMKPPAVFEFGGEPDGVQAILQDRIQAAGYESLLLWSPWEHPCNAMFFEMSGQWSVVSPRMVRLISLAATLNGFGKQIDARLARMAIREAAPVVLEVRETGERVALAVREGALDLASPAGDEPRIILPRRAMTRLLLGPAPASLCPDVRDHAPWLDAICPLDFMIWRNETV